MKYHKTKRGFAGIEILSDLSVRTSAVTYETFDFYVYHGLLMWTAWGLLGFIQLASNRWLKGYWYLNMWIHRLAGTSIMIITLIMGIMAY